MASDTSPPAPHPPRQLDGWKEISAYFGRSVRTVQRWEREFGLPIRRFGLGRSEVVHAYLDDLERWKATAEATAAGASSRNGVAQHDIPSGASPAREAKGDDAAPAWRRVGLPPKILLAAVVLAGLTAVSLWPSGSETPRPSREPAAWEARADTLIVKDGAGEVLWRYVFPFNLQADPRDPMGQPLRIEDVDGDGRREVVFKSESEERENCRFYAFSHDGALRWTFSHRTPQTFGEVPYVPPFKASAIFVTPRGQPGKNVWLSSVHNPWFPSVVSKVEADGRASSEYWSNGYITALWEGELAGSRVVLVGARNNESEGASVALLDAANPSGSSPASNARYACRTCPPGSPRYFIQVPKPARLRALGGTSAVAPFQVDASARIVVRINHGADVRGGFDGDVIYTLDQQLRPLSVGLSDRYGSSTETLARRGVIPPPPATSALEEVRTIRWWDGARFVDLIAPVPGLSK